ncbi:TetR family transcriptional regulator [Amycolatopsis taiwanensis]|uniref:TetR family transcriptional regulator n=2 Tax=Amycolatopsis taiwanensis TaxID=342230 RepID=A0A9W6R699_9PSEU|nr:TetR family transcriptional regulator [Amycolatopsis taiwanensis]
MNKNVERGKTTRAQLIEIASRLFASRGYDRTSIDAVLAESGASRGSLYHHFKNKEALFLAVVKDASARASRPAAEEMRAAPDSLAALRVGCLAWIRLAGDPAVRQIVLIDAPAVLGWQRWRALDEQGPLGTIRGLLADAAHDGGIEPHHVDAFARIVLAALNELSMMVAHAEDRTKALATAESAVEEFLDRLLAPVVHAG